MVSGNDRATDLDGGEAEEGISPGIKTRDGICIPSRVITMSRPFGHWCHGDFVTALNRGRDDRESGES
uniref:Uncharacterized protein n=1 Tax=Leersia perrieri TaxID=77586 RepID=A0A0D9XYM7_9ORYZ